MIFGGRQGKTNSPEGQVGLCNAQDCTISFPGVRDLYVPRTPPLNKEYSAPGSGFDYEFRLEDVINEIWMQTLAGLRVHNGILFSSVSRLNKSSAAAIKVASTVTVVVFRALCSCFLAGRGTLVEFVDEPEATAGAAGAAGVLERLGSSLTVRSLP